MTATTDLYADIGREWDDGEFDTDEDAPRTDSVGDYGTDNAGDAAATGLVSDDIDAALDELVAEDAVTEKRLDRDGESVTYYRLNQIE